MLLRFRAVKVETQPTSASPVISRELRLIPHRTTLLSRTRIALRIELITHLVVFQRDKPCVSSTDGSNVCC